MDLDFLFSKKIMTEKKLLGEKFIFQDLEDEYNLTLLNKSRYLKIIFDIVIIIFILTTITLDSLYFLVDSDNLNIRIPTCTEQEAPVIDAKLWIIIDCILLIIFVSLIVISRVVCNSKFDCIFHFLKWLLISLTLIFWAIKMHDHFFKSEKVAISFVSIIFLSLCYLTCRRHNYFFFTLNLIMSFFICNYSISGLKRWEYWFFANEINAIQNVLVFFIKSSETSRSIHFFLREKRYQTYFNYLEKMIDNMHIKLITLKDGNIMYMNKEERKEVYPLSILNEIGSNDKIIYTEHSNENEYYLNTETNRVLTETNRLNNDTNKNFPRSNPLLSRASHVLTNSHLPKPSVGTDIMQWDRDSKEFVDPERQEDRKYNLNNSDKMSLQNIKILHENLEIREKIQTEPLDDEKLHEIKKIEILQTPQKRDSNRLIKFNKSHLNTNNESSNDNLNNVHVKEFKEKKLKFNSKEFFKCFIFKEYFTDTSCEDFVDHAFNTLKSSNLTRRLSDNSNDQTEWTLYDILQIIIKNKDFKHRNSFISLGRFKNTKDSKLLQVHIRKIIVEESVIVDCMFFDVSSIQDERAISALKIKENETKIKTKIFSKIIHEFKTPLNSIISIIHQIKEIENEVSLEVRKYLNQIDGLSNYTIFLISDIINYASEYKSLNFTIVKSNVKTNLEFTLEILKSLLYCNDAKNKNIKPYIQIDHDPDLTVDIDEFRLRQILLNFISNSVKFTKSGSIGILSGLTERNQLFITIKDSGSGIKEEDKEKLFKEFSMLESHKNSNSQGTGLGLSICVILAENMNMKLSFESKEGVGSSFTITSINPVVEKNEDIVVKSLKLQHSITPILKTNEVCVLSPKKNQTSLNFASPSKTLDIRQEDEDNVICSQYLYKTFKSNYKQSLLRRTNPDLNFTVDDKDNISDVNLSTKILDNPINLDTFQHAKDVFFPQVKKILVVDDNTILRKSLKRQIAGIVKQNNLSYVIEELQDGIDIVYEIIKDVNNDIKFVFTDENMDFLNGSKAIEILNDLYHENKIEKVTYVCVTGFDAPEVKDMIRNSGADYVISKPPDPAEIEKILKKEI